MISRPFFFVLMIVNCIVNLLNLHSLLFHSAPSVQEYHHLHHLLESDASNRPTSLHESSTHIPIVRGISTSTPNNPEIALSTPSSTETAESAEITPQPPESNGLEKRYPQPRGRRKHATKARPVQYLHDAIIRGSHGQVSISRANGFVTKSMIFAGEIVFVEHPWLLFPTNLHSDFSKTKVQFFHEVQRKMNSDIEFWKMWSSVGSRAINPVQINDHHFGSDKKLYGVYQLFRAIKLGTRPNLAVMFGKVKEDHMCVAIAIVDIPRGSNLMISSSISGPNGTLHFGHQKQVIPHEVQQFLESREVFKTLNRVRKMNIPDWASRKHVQGMSVKL